MNKGLDIVKKDQAVKNKEKGNSSNKPDFYVVGIGASAGGIKALEQFFTNMPENSNMAFVVIQHLSPDYKSLMAEILSRNTKMKIYRIKNGIKIQPGCIFLNPPRYDVTISNGHLYVKEQQPINRVNLTINVFFESLAKSMVEKSIGIIMSGTGSDGTRGCRAIKEAGGIVIAQDIKTANFNGMPKSVIATNICDFILPPFDMPEKLIKYAGQFSFISQLLAKDKIDNKNADILSRIYNIIQNRYSVNFSLYKQSTVLRCIERRIRICQMSTLKEYHSYLKDNFGELDRLYNSLLIGVTRFFRDSGAYNVIKNEVIPNIVRSKKDDDIIRVWVAGCSTGEEAYSIAILFKEYFDSTKSNMNVKIFATDIDSNAIKYASAGIYPESISEDVSLERLNRYFIKKRDGYYVSKHIRSMVIFSKHNVVNNPPFNRINLLSCRNLLIYFKPDIKKRIISTFQFALKTNGYLFLGTSETTGEMNKYFSTTDAKWKIFKKNNMRNSSLVEDLSFISTNMKVIDTKSEENYYSQRTEWEREDINTLLIEECLPPGVLVNKYGELIHSYGDVDKYLKVPRGMISYDIQKMVPEELSAAVGTAIRKVKKVKKQVTYSNIKVKIKQDKINVNLNVRPLLSKKRDLLILIIFEKVNVNRESEENREDYDTVKELHERIKDLEQELAYTKESLQTSLEEIETSSEELQSANEELLVSNEELHSTNEELQSVNQELMVVNNQYQYKIQELADLNNDMTNFLNSTDIGTIFLDSNLCVRKFTPAIAKEINLLKQDIGRPISHISHNLKNEDLVSQSQKVMDNLVPTEKEIQSLSGKWYILKYSPFRTNENVIKGIVISLVNITERKVAEKKQIKSRQKLKEAITLDALKSDFFSNLSHELRTPLNVIMSTIQLLESNNANKGLKTLTDKQKKHFMIMKQNCYRLLKLVNNIIDSTKIDSGFFKVIKENHNIVSIVENITISVYNYVKNKGIKLKFNTNVEERTIACDLNSFERIILNLLSNAVKFTKKGGSITVKITDRIKSVLISVKDTGIGIPKDKQNVIFDRFRQVDKSLTRNYEGSGIGLSLVKKLVELHEGKISVKSEPGNGAEFIIEIPVKTLKKRGNVLKPKNIQQCDADKIYLEFSDICNSD